MTQTLSDSSKRQQYDMLHKTASSTYARRGMGGAPGGSYQGMAYSADPFSRADADRLFTETFGNKNPFEVMEELQNMMNAFSQLS